MILKLNIDTKCQSETECVHRPHVISSRSEYKTASKIPEDGLRFTRKSNTQYTQEFNEKLL